MGMTLISVDADSANYSLIDSNGLAFVRLVSFGEFKLNIAIG